MKRHHLTSHLWLCLTKSYTHASNSVQNEDTSKLCYKVRTFVQHLKCFSPTAKSEHYNSHRQTEDYTLTYTASCSAQNVDTQLHQKLSYVQRTWFDCHPYTQASNSVQNEDTYKLATKWGLLSNFISSLTAKSAPQTHIQIEDHYFCAGHTMDTQLHTKPFVTNWGHMTTWNSEDGPCMTEMNNAEDGSDCWATKRGHLKEFWLLQSIFQGFHML